MIALFILYACTSNVVVQAQSPCSISGVDFYPQTAYPGQTVNVISQVIFSCGPGYNTVWKVRVDFSNSEYNITSTNSVQHVYASYANTRINVTDTFTAPQKTGALTLDASVYVMSQSSGKIFASWASVLEIQVQPVAVATTTSSTRVPNTTTRAPTPVTLTTNSTTTATAFFLSTDQVYMILAVVLSVLFIAVVVVRLRQTLRGKTRDNIDSSGPGPA